MARETGADLRNHSCAVVPRGTSAPEVCSTLARNEASDTPGKLNSAESRARILGWFTTVAVLFGAHVGVVVFFSHNDPYSSHLFPECIWRQITGWECPGCGGTRAVYSLFRGDFVASIAMNPLVVASYASLLSLGAQAVVSATGRRTVQWPHWLAMSLIITAAAYSGIIRNL